MCACVCVYHESNEMSQVNEHVYMLSVQPASPPASYACVSTDKIAIIFRNVKGS